MSILLADRIPSWCLLHELAHAMTNHADRRSDGHGPLFMEIYVQLLARYLRFDRRKLINSILDAKIQIHCDARPVLLIRDQSGAARLRLSGIKKTSNDPGGKQATLAP
jgi:hypothetical protein